MARKRYSPELRNSHRCLCLLRGAPMWVVCASALCVNLRFIIFRRSGAFTLVLSRARRVALSYFLADLNLLVFQKAWPDGGREEAQVPYFLGGATWGLGFAGTIPTLGLAYWLLAGRATLVAAMVAASAAIDSYALPLTLIIVVAIAAAVASSCG